MRSIEEVMTLGPVIPVLVIEDEADARPVAEALVAGGIRVLEVTLRTRAALAAIQSMKQVPGAVVGAGTVLNAEDAKRSVDAGAEFIVSPGLTKPLGRAAIEMKVPLLPGVATGGDIMRGLDLGLSHFKFFPAAASGGVPALKALSGPFGQAHFCPTGGITADTAPDWLALPQVLCVGGSWLIRDAGNLPAIEAAARAAAALGRA